MMQPGADLMFLHPDGREEVLVKGGRGSVADPFISFDGEWVFYARFHDLTQSSTLGADIFKLSLRTRRITQLTHGEWTPNTGVVGRKDLVRPRVFNLAPCPVPGRRVVFTSSRNYFQPTKGYTSPTLQLFAMDDNGNNVEMIGFLNLGSALHPTIIQDGRVMYSSYESQALRDLRTWGLWAISPDGTNWGPVLSSFADTAAFHFHTQLSDGNLVVESYYNLNNLGFGTYYKFPAHSPQGYSPFGPGYRLDDRNPILMNPLRQRFPFSPQGIESLTRFVSIFDSPAPPSDPSDQGSIRVGKFTHPSGAPDNHLLTVWSPGAVWGNDRIRPRQSMPASI